MPKKAPKSPAKRKSLVLQGDAVTQLRSLLAGAPAARVELQGTTLHVIPEGDGPSEAGGTVTFK